MAAETPTVWTFGTLGLSDSCFTLLLTAWQRRFDWWVVLGGYGGGSTESRIPLRAACVDGMRPHKVLSPLSRALAGSHGA